MDYHLDLCGLWDFAYRADRTFDLDTLPSDQEFCTDMPIPGYWDDHLDRLKHTSLWSRDVRFNPNYRQIEYPLGSGKPFDTSLLFCWETAGIDDGSGFPRSGRIMSSCCA